MYLHVIKSQPVIDLVNVICSQITAKIYRENDFTLLCGSKNNLVRQSFIRPSSI